MIIERLEFYSSVLETTARVNVLLPDDDTPLGARRHPVLYLLHGYSGNENDWLTRTMVLRHVDKIAPNFIVVMPNADNGFYNDMYAGLNYYTYFSQELPKKIASLFPVSPRREDTFVAGLSMGGFGALKLAVNQPERFAAAASLSGVVDVRKLTKKRAEMGDMRLQNIVFGPPERLRHTPNDLRFRAMQASAQGVLPRLYIYCGDEDDLFDTNVGFCRYLKQHGVSYLWEKDKGYAHSWEYWDYKIRRVLEEFAQMQKKAAM